MKAAGRFVRSGLQHLLSLQCSSLHVLRGSNWVLVWCRAIGCRTRRQRGASRWSYARSTETRKVDARKMLFEA